MVSNKRYPIPEKAVHDILSAIHNGMNRKPAFYLAERGTFTSRDTAQRLINALKDKMFIFISGPKSDRHYKLSATGEKHLFDLMHKYDKIVSASFPQRSDEGLSANLHKGIGRPSTNAERIAERISEYEKIYVAENHRFLFDIKDKDFDKFELLWDQQIQMNNWVKKTAYFKDFTLDKTTRSIRIIIGGVEHQNPYYLMLKVRQLAKDAIKDVLKGFEKQLGRKVKCGEPRLEGEWHLETNDPDSEKILNLFKGTVQITELDKEKGLKIQRDRSRYGHDLAIYADDPEGVAEYLMDIDAMPIRVRKTNEIVNDYQELAKQLLNRLDLISRCKVDQVGMERERLDLEKAKAELDIAKEKSKHGIENGNQIKEDNKQMYG